MSLTILGTVFTALLAVIGWLLSSIFSQQKKVNEKVDNLVTAVDVIKTEMKNGRDVCHEVHAMVDYRLDRIEGDGIAPKRKTGQ